MALVTEENTLEVEAKKVTDEFPAAMKTVPGTLTAELVLVRLT